jgi:4-hydroxybenzoate polyprenyltransferase
LVHPFPVTVVVTTSVALVVVAHGGYPGTSFLLRAAAAVLFCQASVGALNDYVDRDFDRLFQPDKPLASGRASARVALALSTASGVLSALFALTLGWQSMLVLLLATSGGWIYDLWLGRGPFSVVGYLVGFLGLLSWIWLINSQLRFTFLLVSVAAAPVIAAAHLANAAPDIETDEKIGIRNLAVVLGARRVVWSIFTLYAASALAGAVLCIAAHSAAGAAFLIASLALAVLAVLTLGEAVTRQARVLLFRLFAPSAGLLGIGCLIAWRQMG